MRSSRSRPSPVSALAQRFTRSRELAVGVAAAVVDVGDLAGAARREIALDEIVRGVVVARNVDVRRARSMIGRAQRRHCFPSFGPALGAAAARVRPAMVRGRSRPGEFDRALRQQIEHQRPSAGDGRNMRAARSRTPASPRRGHRTLPVRRSASRDRSRRSGGDDGRRPRSSMSTTSTLNPSVAAPGFTTRPYLMPACSRLHIHPAAMPAAQASCTARKTSPPAGYVALRSASSAASSERSAMRRVTVAIERCELILCHLGVARGRRAASVMVPARSAS